MKRLNPPLSPREALAQRIAQTTYRLLRNEGLVRQHPAFEALPWDERVILAFDPLALRKPEAVVSERFVHRLSTTLGGRRVVPTNSRGLFLQVAYRPPPPVTRLESAPLDLSQQPSPLHVPIGRTQRGDLWLSLPEIDSVLIGGTRRMGKTNLLHTWIQALLHGGQARLFLWDGKGGVEFARYTAHPLAQVSHDLDDLLPPLSDAMVRRQALLRRSGHPNLAAYQQATGDRLPLLVLIVDELAQAGETEQDALARLVAVGGAFGVHPVLATQRPDAGAVRGLIRSNLATRIALPVPTRHESQIILGRSGAEKLPKMPGRLLFTWNARLVVAQAYRAVLDASAPGPKSRSLLAPWEVALVRVAVQELGGWFRIRDLAEATGVSRDRINVLAKRWEAMGYLTPVQRDARGHSLGRQVTLTLVEAAGLGGSADQADRADLADQAPEVG